MTAGINAISISRGAIKGTRVQVDNPPQGGISGWPFRLYIYPSQDDVTAIAVKSTGFSVVASDTVEVQWVEVDTTGLAPNVYYYVLLGLNNLVLSEGPLVVTQGVPDTVTPLAVIPVVPGQGGTGHDFSAATGLLYFDNGNGEVLLVGAGLSIVNGNTLTASGDMLKSVYDTNGDGIVDAAAIAALATVATTALAAPWSGITGTRLATASGLTMSTAKILARTTAGTGAVEEVAVSGATLAGGTLTISGLAIGGTVTGGTAGLVPYIAAGPVLAQSANMAFDGSRIASLGFLDSADSGTGWYKVGTQDWRYKAGSADQIRLQYGLATFNFDVTVAGTLTVGTASKLVEDAANTLAQRNGTAAQTLRVYKTTDGAGNASWMEFLGYNATDLAASIHTNKSGTGTAPDLYFQQGPPGGTGSVLYLGTAVLVLGTITTGRVQFNTNNTGRWIIDASGHLSVSAGQIVDIGNVDPTLSPRTGYFGTSVVVGSGTASIKLNATGANDGGPQMQIGNVYGGVPYAHSRIHVKAPSASPWAFTAEASNSDNLAAFGHDGIAATFISSFLNTGAYSPIVFKTSSATRLTIGVDGTVAVAGAMTVGGPVIVGPYTFATVPAASSYTGAVIRITDRSGKYAYSDGTNWRWYNTNAVIASEGSVPQNSQSADYTLVLTDDGAHIFHPASDANARTFTIPANASVAFPLGATVTFVNRSANAVTIAITSDTLTWSPSGSTGSRTLAQYGSATAVKIGTTEWLIQGGGIT